MLRSCYIASVAISLMCVVLQGDEPPTQAPFSSPKATVKTLLSLIDQGALRQQAECFVSPSSEAETNLLLYGMKEDVYGAALRQALLARFGETSVASLPVAFSLEQQLEVIESMEEKINEDKGRLGLKGQELGSMAFVNLEGQWKIALRPSFMLRAPSSKTLVAEQKLRAAYLDTIAEVKDGTFTTADASLATLATRKLAAKAKN